MKIIVDCHGADKGVATVVKGAVEALNEKEGFGLILVGDREKIENALKGEKNTERTEILEATEEITCDEEPVKAIKTKKQSSVVLGLERLRKDEEAKAFVSAGSTGAVLVGSLLLVGRLPGVSRPALCPVLPTASGQVLLLDSGANADCKPVNLCHFALMGSAYSEVVLGIKNPKVALLSNGTESHKGNQLVHDVYPMLEKIEGLNFVGNTEGRDLLSGKFDVVVTDGFSGNVELKATEGAIKFLMKELKTEIYSSVKGKLGGLLLKNTFKNLMNKLDYSSHGGAMLLGIKKPVFKAHGASEATAVKNTVLQAVGAVESGLVESISDKLKNVDLSQFNAE